MVSFTLLSDLILSLQGLLPRRPVPLEQFREAAAEVALARYGAAVLGTPALVNLAGLALSLERPVVYRPDAAAIAQIDATDLRNVPAEPPRLMRGAFLIETQDLQEPLFLDVVSFGAYRLGADWWLVCERFPDGIAVVRWAPVWAQQEEIGAGVVFDDGALIEGIDQDEWADYGRQGARFAIILGLLLEAEGAPIAERTTEPPKGPAPKFGQKRKPGPGWTVRSITVPPQERPVHAEPPVPPVQTGHPAHGLRAETVTVRGFLRRQPHGPGGSLRKWIYVTCFESRRWIAPRPLRVNVNGAAEPGE